MHRQSRVSIAFFWFYRVTVRWSECSAYSRHLEQYLGGLVNAVVARGCGFCLVFVKVPDRVSSKSPDILSDFS